MEMWLYDVGCVGVGFIGELVGVGIVLGKVGFEFLYLWLICIVVFIG